MYCDSHKAHDSHVTNTLSFLVVNDFTAALQSLVKTTCLLVQRKTLEKGIYFWFCKKIKREPEFCKAAIRPQHRDGFTQYLNVLTMWMHLFWAFLKRVQLARILRPVINGEQRTHSQCKDDLGTLECTFCTRQHPSHSAQMAETCRKPSLALFWQTSTWRQHWLPVADGKLSQDSTHSTTQDGVRHLYILPEPCVNLAERWPQAPLKLLLAQIWQTSSRHETEYLLSMTAKDCRIAAVVSAPCNVAGNSSQNWPHGSSSCGPAALPQNSLMLVWRITSCAPLTSDAWCSCTNNCCCC